jgi:hypothetical protein
VVSARLRASAEIGLACAAVLGCALSWSQARSSVQVAPVADGEPVTTSISYDPPLLLLTLLLATFAGVLAVVGTARLRRVHKSGE